MRKYTILLVLLLNLGFGIQNFGAMTREEKEKLIEEINTTYEKEDINQSIKLITKYLSEYPNDANYLNLLAEVYENKKNYIEAEKNYLKAIEKGNLNAIRNLAGMYYDQSKNDKALKYYEEFLKYAENEYVYFMIGSLHQASGRITEAKKYFLKSAEMNKDGYAENRLGLIYDEDEGNQKEALKWYLKGAEKGNISAQRNLSLFYLELGNYTEAEKWIKKAIENAKKENDLERVKEMEETLKEIELEK